MPVHGTMSRMQQFPNSRGWHATCRLPAVLSHLHRALLRVQQRLGPQGACKLHATHVVPGLCSLSAPLQALSLPPGPPAHGDRVDDVQLIGMQDTILLSPAGIHDLQHPLHRVRHPGHRHGVHYGRADLLPAGSRGPPLVVAVLPLRRLNRCDNRATRCACQPSCIAVALTM